MYYLAVSSDLYETIENTNGEHGGDKLPVFIWPKDFEELTFSTKTSDSGYMPNKKVSLLDKYQKWKKDN